MERESISYEEKKALCAPRHAYCIIAHSDPYLLETLISLIDDERNDIYILFDKKCNQSVFDHINTKKSNFIRLKPLIDIRWGDVSQIEAELNLFSEVQKSNITYDFIHLISGSDLPLQTQHSIHDYLNRLDSHINLISFATDQANISDLKFKTSYRHFFTKKYRNKSIIATMFYRILRDSALLIQKKCNIIRDWTGYTLAKGSNWVSIRSEFLYYLLDRRDEIIERFKNVRCGDEIYKQTMLLSSPFRDTSFKADNLPGNLREIDWHRGGPYVWRESDYEQLINSGCLFARKFSTSVDKDIIDKIRKHLNDQK